MGLYESSENDAAKTRYLAMEGDAGVVLLVLFVVGMTCFWLFRPWVWLPIGGFLGGVITYFCWQFALAKHYRPTGFAAAASILISSISFQYELHRPLTELLCMLAFPGLGLYGSIFIRRLLVNHR